MNFKGLHFIIFGVCIGLLPVHIVDANLLGITFSTIGIISSILWIKVIK